MYERGALYNSLDPWVVTVLLKTAIQCFGPNVPSRNAYRAILTSQVTLRASGFSNPFLISVSTSLSRSSMVRHRRRSFLRCRCLRIRSAAGEGVTGFAVTCSAVTGSAGGEVTTVSVVCVIECPVCESAKAWRGHRSACVGCSQTRRWPPVSPREANFSGR
jgi:hypothetical protein